MRCMHGIYVYMCVCIQCRCTIHAYKCRCAMHIYIYTHVCACMSVSFSVLDAFCSPAPSALVGAPKAPWIAAAAIPPPKAVPDKLAAKAGLADRQGSGPKKSCKRSFRMLGRRCFARGSLQLSQRRALWASRRFPHMPFRQEVR